MPPNNYFEERTPALTAIFTTDSLLGGFQIEVWTFILRLAFLPDVSILVFGKITIREFAQFGVQTKRERRGIKCSFGEKICQQTRTNGLHQLVWEKEDNKNIIVSETV